MGAGITVYIDAAPAGSRFRDRLQLQYRLQMLRDEVAALVPSATRGWKVLSWPGTECQEWRSTSAMSKGSGT